MNALVKHDIIADICAQRQVALSLYRQSWDVLATAAAAHRDACRLGRSQTRTPTFTIDHHRDYGFNTFDGFVAAMTKEIDAGVWRSLIDATPLGSLMDKQEREAFEKSLEDPAAVTEENVQATLERLAGDANMIFRRGLVNAFASFCRDYKSNDGFKVGERIVITYGVKYEKMWDTFNASYHNNARLDDLDRVVHVLDGKLAKSWPDNLSGRLTTACNKWRDDNLSVFETPYWRVKFFKNGNVHLWMKDDELRNKVNRLIAEHYGETLPGPKVTPAEDRVDVHKLAEKDFNFFATSPDVVALMMVEAEIVPDHLVLEPSAGEGALAAAAAAIVGLDQLDMIEIDLTRHTALRAALHEATKQIAADVAYTLSPPSILYGDFLAEPMSVREGEYDRVLMNPPFSNGRDVIHTLKGYRCLKRGGRLVGITARGAHMRADKFAAALRALNPRVIALPSGSFKHAGTMVETQIIVIDKEK